jgi:hypothetical protein
LSRTANYGSKHVNEHPLAVKGANLSADRKTITLNIEGMQPTWCMEIGYSFRGEDGKSVTGTVHNTVHALAE